MVHSSKTDAGQFCWLDLAATDAEKAKAFYGNLFGWTSYEQPANGGSFTRLRLWGQDVGSLYQLKSALLGFHRTGRRMFALTMLRQRFSAPLLLAG